VSSSSAEVRIVCLAVAVLLAIASGCGGGDSGVTESGETSGPGGETTAATSAPAAETVTPSRCPPSLAGCRTTEGRIVYVERVDPDGDGDAHFVVGDPQGITLPGLTAIDVREGLRPQPLPGPGDLISAAGQVQTGSYGQSQIHAVELHLAGE
jgi:hypothetical protein